MNNNFPSILHRLQHSLMNIYLFTKTKTSLFIILTTFITIFFLDKETGFKTTVIYVSILAFLLFYKIDLLFRNLNRINFNYNNLSRQLLVETHNALLLSIRHPKAYMPVSDYTMKPNNLILLETIFLTKKPLLTLELGSGLSTHLLSSLAKSENKGHIISFDHDYDWVQLTQQFLRINGLSEFSEVIHIPLVKHGNDTCEWYDYEPYQNKIKGIDLLVIDGPPAVIDIMIREGALKHLFEFLNDDAIVFVDDAARQGETQIVNNWIKQYPFLKVQKYNTLTGAYIINVNKGK